MKYNWRLVIVLGLASSFLTAPAIAVVKDKDFVNKAAIGNTFEIESSRWALHQSQNDDIKSFAQTMVDDHTEIANDLKTVLSDSDANIPVPDNKLDPAHQKKIDKLSGLDGAELDRHYVKGQIEAHNEAIKLFSDYAAHGRNAALKAFANRTLPVIKKHRSAIPQAE